MEDSICLRDICPDRLCIAAAPRAEFVWDMDPGGILERGDDVEHGFRRAAAHVDYIEARVSVGLTLQGLQR